MMTVEQLLEAITDACPGCGQELVPDARALAHANIYRESGSRIALEMAQRFSVHGRCEACKALEHEPQGEPVRLFDPAPAPLKGQGGLW